MYLVRKDLKEWNGVLDSMEVRRDQDPSEEVVQLPPVCGVLVDLGRGEAFGDSRMFSILHIRYLATHIRRQSIQGEVWGEVEQKCRRKSWRVRWVSLDLDYASLLSCLVVFLMDV